MESFTTMKTPWAFHFNKYTAFHLELHIDVINFYIMCLAFNSEYITDNYFIVFTPINRFYFIFN